MVGHADLDDRPAGRVQLDQQLGREERAARLDRDPREGVTPEQLAGAVDVADLEAEPDPVGEPVQPGVDRPDERVRPLDPVADDGVGLIGLAEAGGEPAEVRDPELAVAVGERDELVAGGPEAGQQRRAVAEVRRVVDGPDDAGVRRGQLVGDRAGRVARPVVHDDDLEHLGERRQGLERLRDELADVGLLVMGREEVGQPRDALGHG